MIEIAKRTLRKVTKGQKGQALPVVLILLVIGGLLIVPTLRYASTSLKAHQVVESKALELYAADSGIEEALHWLIHGKDTSGPWTWVEDEESGSGSGSRETYNLNGKDVDIDVERTAEMDVHYYRITSAASSADGSTTVLSTVWAAPVPLDGFGSMGPGGTWDGDVYIDGSDTLQSHQHVNGNVVVTGDLTLNAQSGITGDVSVGGDLTLKAWSTVHGNVCAGGSITINAQAVLDGDGDIYAYISGAEIIELKGQAQVGDIYVDGEPGSSITIRLSNKDTTGNIYVSPDVSLIQDFHSGATHGDVVEDWDGEHPPPPECADVPVGGGHIKTYEIT